jgi:hypothetical protein
MNKFIFLFFIVSFIECTNLKIDDLCYPKEQKDLKCYGNNYSFACGDFICTKNQYICHVLSLFSGLQGEHRKNYESFMIKIKNCPEPPKYKWNKNNVCLNTKNCVKPSIHRLWSTKIKLVECECIGKHSFKCNSDYCGTDKQACDGLNRKKMIGVKYCDQKKNRFTKLKTINLI